MWTIAVVLIMLWALGLATGYSTDYFIHIPFFLAIIAILIQIEDDCSNYASGHMKKGYVKSQKL